MQYTSDAGDGESADATSTEDGKVSDSDLYDASGGRGLTYY